MIALSAHLGTLFGELPPLARPAAACAAGFDAVEAWWPPADAPADWVAAVREAGARAVLVNADGGDLAAGERGYCNVPGRGDEAVAAAVAAARTVTAAGGEVVNLLVGRALAGTPRARQLATARDVVREAADAVAPLGARLVVEHLNGVDVADPLLPTPAAAAEFVAAVGHGGVRLLLDAYHAAAAGLDPAAEAAAAGSLIGHAQYADHPGRGAPGTGTLDLRAFVDALAEAGYAGHVGLEFVPAGPTAEALAAVDAP
ncbi:TIM barrel protein [Miltoncostaea marina]|uniref:TIM barrel protein n=1 Tax=Miltoncostaea marina TaxID=2843215 RepID=UPI001C3C93E7|nr:TIM barrel protein [Miltoncostaea marina]